MLTGETRVLAGFMPQHARTSLCLEELLVDIVEL